MKKRLLLILMGITLIFIGVYLMYNRYTKDRENKSFIMYIEDKYTKDDNVYLTGIVKKGRLTVNDVLEVVGCNIDNITVNEIYVNNEEKKEATIGDKVIINAGKVDINEFKRGVALAGSNIVKFTRNVEMEITLDSDVTEQIKRGSGLVFQIGPENYGGEIDMEDSLVATQTGIVNVTFDDKVPVYEDVSVIVKYDGIRIIGSGRITKVK